MSENNEKKSFLGNIKSIVTGTVELLNKTVETRLTPVMTKSFGQLPEAVRLSLGHDPEIDRMGGAFLERSSWVPFETCRKMADRDVIVAAIVNKRCNQVAAFSRVATDKYGPGFRLKMIQDEAHSDEKTEQLKDSIQNFIANTGRVTEDRPFELRCSFDRFLRKIVYDLIVFDAMAIENVFTESGELFCFLHVAADTIRYAFNNDYNKDIQEGQIDAHTDTKEEETRVAVMKFKHKRIDPLELRYVQIVGGRTAASFTPEELYYCSFTPNTDIYNPYSVPPLEKAMNTVSSHLFAESHNRLYFTQSGSTRGMLVLKSENAIPPHQLDAFRRQYYNEVVGAKNAWRTPIIALDGKSDANFLAMQMSNRDAEYVFWMQYLVQTLCAVFGIDPTEIGWTSNASNNAIFDSSGTKIENQIKFSRDSGLIPLMRFIEDYINGVILKGINPDIPTLFKFEWVGLTEEGIDQEIDRSTRQLQYMGIDEIRARCDLEPLNIDLAKIPLPLIPYYMQEMQMQQMTQSQEKQPDKKEEAEKSVKAIQVEYYKIEK